MTSEPVVDESAGERRGLRPGTRFVGTLGVPPSKSLAQRAILMAALARGSTRLTGLGPERDLCADVLAALALVRGCGVTLEVSDGELVVHGSAWSPAGALEVGESGTLARLATAALALPHGVPPARVVLTGAGSLLGRGSAPLFESLRAAGALLEGPPGSDRWPVTITPARVAPASLTLSRPVSSQEVSALLLALAAHEQASEVVIEGSIPSRPYLDMTVSVLRRFGVELAESAQEQGATSFTVQGPLRAPATPFALEPDASAAAVGLAAACITDGEILIAGLAPASQQGDVRVAEYLTRFGCHARFVSSGLQAGGRPTRGAVLDLSGEPDLAPVLAAVAAAVAIRAEPGASHATTRLTGLATLQRKESRRIDVLAEALRRLGLEVEATDESLVIVPGTPSAEPLVLDPHGDHRMAFAFALFGLARDGVEVLDAACVAKSWPRFWSEMGRLGA